MMERASGEAAGGGRNATGNALAGFLAMCFAVVGFTGLLAAQVGPLPLERAVAREAVLDQAVALARAGDGAGLEALRPLLADSAVVLPADAGFEARVAAERVAMRARLLAEAQATGLRLRVMLVVVTVLAGAFGVAMLLAAQRIAVRVAARGGLG
jgi:hypothetical protein